MITEIKDAEMLKSSFAAEEPDDAGELNLLGCFFLETSRRPDKHINTLGGGTKAHRTIQHIMELISPHSNPHRRVCTHPREHTLLKRHIQRSIKVAPALHPQSPFYMCVVKVSAFSLKGQQIFPPQVSAKARKPRAEPLLRQEKNISR